MGNKFQWDRLDEIFMFVIGLGFLLLLAHMNVPSEAIMTMGGSLIAVVPIYIKSALERKNDNGNGNVEEKVINVPNGLPLVTDTPPVLPVKASIHYLRESE